MINTIVLTFILLFSSSAFSGDLFNFPVMDTIFKNSASSISSTENKSDHIETAEEHLNKICVSENILKRKLEFKRLFNLKKYGEANETIKSLYYECNSQIYDGKYTDIKKAEAYYWFIADLTLSSYKVEDTNFCLALGLSEMTERNIPFEEITQTKAFKSVAYNVDLCKKRREDQISNNFIVEKCPFSNSGYITSKVWNGEGAEFCVGIYSGNSGQNIMDKEGNKYGKEDYPYLQLLIKENEKIENRKLFFSSGIFSEESYCFTGKLDNVEFLAVGGTYNNMLLRIKSYFGFCWPGSASLVTDSVYRIDLKKGLVPVNELTITLH